MEQTHPHGALAPAQPPRIDEAGPFLKWAGGKGRLISQYRPHFPKRFRKYHEPFLGGGAVFFHLQPRAAFLSDSNFELIDTYTAIRDDVAQVIKELQAHRYEKEHYYRIRDVDPRKLNLARRAARMIFLNRTCFNGLYRLNKQGKFNVPIGSYKNPTICHRQKLLAASRALTGTSLECRSFDTVLQRAVAGDLVYFDPPYHPLSDTANFTSYDRNGFGEEDQIKLAWVMRELRKRGAFVMQSNSDSPFIRKLYRGFNIRTVRAGRAINSLASRRGQINELLITNY